MTSTRPGRTPRFLLIGLIVLPVLTVCSSVINSDPVGSSAGRLAPDPLNAVYRIEDKEIRLREGRFETPAAPGSAATVSVIVVGTPIRGHLDDDRDRDAAVILVYQAGGSGTFYYLAAAIRRGDGYRGTNALLLGDRINPQPLRIQNGVIIAEFADRRPGEPLAAEPAVPVTRYAYLDGDSLAAVPAESEEAGWVTFGHEVRSFSPCTQELEHWLLGQSPALSDIASTYRNTMIAAPPYARLFMVLNGSFTKPPSGGFGADYAGGFFATGLIKADPTGHCRQPISSRR